MLLRYPGNGNSIPSLRTVATSVPLSPTGPPPAFGASVFGCGVTFASAGPAFATGLALASDGVTRAGVFGAGLAVGNGMSLTDDCEAVGGVTAVFAAVCSLFTSPIARSPAGAAMISTRYIGGNATAFRSFRVLNRSVAIAA